MITYTSGLSFKCERVITKKDIIKICLLLNDREEYKNICNFKPEPITEGGIVYCFFKNDKRYKSVRFRCNGLDYHKKKWDCVDNNVMTEWDNSDDLVLEANTKMDTFLKSFHNAPVFTIDELKIWEECFKEVGLFRVGKYPAKKNLKCVDSI